MNGFLEGVARILRGLLRLLLIAMTGVFVLTVLLIVFCAVLASMLWSLLTGRRPTMRTNFTRFYQASEPLRRGMWRKTASRSSTENSDIVDVPVHEIRETLRGPGSSRSGDPKV
ncbi:MAG: hypothetical protein K9K38_09620 [Rhodoferax sp.]|nr:hypothetical protein [Rhodoferax sp.]